MAAGGGKFRGYDCLERRGTLSESKYSGFLDSDRYLSSTGRCVGGCRLVLILGVATQYINLTGWLSG
jgi:hypothetical protein